MKKALHKGIFGATGSGKTYYALNTLEESPGRVLFFNPQAEDVDRLMPQADWKDNVRAVIEAKRINYVPQTDLEIARLELRRLAQAMMESPWTHTLICDEAHDFGPQGGSAGPLELVARRGRAKDIVLWAVSVHPADISKTILRQLRTVVLFSLPYSSQYLQAYRIPGDELQELHRKGGEYSFAVWDGLKLTGPHKL